MKQKLIEELGTIEHICTTADIWSAHHRSFFGVTAHWINPNSLDRHSAALACMRMTGRHTFSAIAEHLNSVHSSYRIVSKVVMTVTDNASNFVKAFSEYAQPADDDDDNDNTDDNVQIHDVQSVVSSTEVDDGEDDSVVYLPPHQRCAAHTLNLVATADTELANCDPNYKRLSRAVMAKCSALWNKTSRSTLCADIVREKLDCSLVVPNDTRWNSHYHSVDKLRKLLEQHSDNMSDVCQALDVMPFRTGEVSFLTEYCNVMQPLACALDILQAENKCFIGYLLPTLTSLQTKLRQLKPQLKVAAPLVDAVLQGLAKRFEGYSDREELVLASITLPQFRLRWLDESKKASARAALYQHCHSLSVKQQAVAENPCEPQSQDDDFFDFMQDSNTSSHDTVDSEVDTFLNDPCRELFTLVKYPTIKQLFLQFNTPLPSSAPVERLFSLGGQIFVPRRNRLSDSNFERQLLLRANKRLL